MTDTSWEQAIKKSRKKIKWIIILALFILAPFIIIINNNREFVDNGNDRISPASENITDSLPIFSVSPDDTDTFTDEIIDSARINQFETESVEKNTLESNYSEMAIEKNDSNQYRALNQNTVASEVETTPPVNKLISTQEHVDVVKKDDSTLSNSNVDKKSVVPAQKIINQHNNESTKLYSFLLNDIKTGVSDRKDIYIRLALELFYRDSSLTRSIFIKRDNLKILVKSIIQKKELSTIKKNAVSKEILNQINTQFDEDTLVMVHVREIQIEKVDAQ
jgi:flagellar basal body-associated protein FliL